MNALHPSLALFEPDELALPDLPVCDHYAGTEPRMLKSMALQGELGGVFDITLDCEDGAPVGGEAEQAHLVAEMACRHDPRSGRVGARIHPWGHPAFDGDVHTLLGRAGQRLAYLMLPKPRHLADVEAACAHIDAQAAQLGLHAAALPLHVLIETHGALREVDAIAAHPRVQSLSFGLMDFVSAHQGAIPSSAMGVRGQFEHPLVLRAKLAISAACHGHGKTPSHCVVTEFRDTQALATAASQAAQALAYTRMWSIHPDQIPVIVQAFAPGQEDIEKACGLVLAAQAAHWAPINFRWQGKDTLHDRASFRYYWQVLQRAHRTGRDLPAEVTKAFFASAPAGQPHPQPPNT
jgi:citrate lyase subunit beta/citryl-CoA lyase